MPPAPPPRQPLRQPPRQPLSPAQRQREAAKLLLRLDEMVKQASELAVRSRERVSTGGLGRYRRFTKRVRDFFALASVTEEKIYASPELAESTMATALDRMHARMVVLFVEGSAAFFDLYSRVKHLPLGTHEICGVELRGVLEIRKFLDDPRYEGERGRALQLQADRIVRLVQGIMDRSMPLPDFGDQPSIGPKGQAKRAIKAPPRQAAPPPPPPPSPEPEPDEEEDDPEAHPLTLMSWDDVKDEE